MRVVKESPSTSQVKPSCWERPDALLATIFVGVSCSNREPITLNSGTIRTSLPCSLSYCLRSMISSHRPGPSLLYTFRIWACFSSGSSMAA